MGLLSNLFGNSNKNVVDGNCDFRVEDVVTISGRGTGVIGKVVAEEIHVGDTIVINGKKKAEITNIEKPGQLAESAKAGENCCIYLSKICRQEVNIGDYLTLLKKGNNNSEEQKASTDSVCRNCGSKLNGSVCENCGYSVNIDNPFKNIITDKTAKVDVGDHVLAYLVNQNILDKQELMNIAVEFGYLLLDDDNHYSSLLKVIVPQNQFGPTKIFYIGIQKERILLLDNNFNEEMFKKVSNDMLVMHKVDINNKNEDDYIMHLS